MIQEIPGPRLAGGSRGGNYGAQEASNYIPSAPVRTEVLPQGAAPQPVDRVEQRYILSPHTGRILTETMTLRDVDYRDRPVVAIPANAVVDGIVNTGTYAQGGALRDAQTRNPDAAIILPRLALADRNFEMAGNMLRQANMANPARFMEMLRLYGTGTIDAVMGGIYFADASWRASWAAFFHLFGLVP